MKRDMHSGSRYLIVLAGPSHAGKSTIVERLTDLLDSELVGTSVDDRLPSDVYFPCMNDLRAAYSDIRTWIAQQNCTVVCVESTFTLIREDRTCHIFLDELLQLEILASSLGRTFLSVFVDIPLCSVLARSATDRRLPRELVKRIWYCSMCLKVLSEFVIVAGGEEDVGGLACNIMCLLD